MFSDQCDRKLIQPLGGIDTTGNFRIKMSFNMNRVTNSMEQISSGEVNGFLVGPETPAYYKMQRLIIVLIRASHLS